MLLAPATAIFVAGFAVPLAMVFRFSVNAFVPLVGMQPGLTLDHYRDVLLSGYFHAVLLRSFLIALAVVACDVVLGYPLALAIARGPRPLRMPVLGMVLLPLVVSVVVRTFGWEVLLSSNGPLVSALRAVFHARITLLYNVNGIVIGLTHVLLPFMVLSLLGSLSSLDPHLETAAASLGAGPVRTFCAITLPLTLEGLATGSVLVLVLALSAFVTPEILGGGKVGILAGVIYEQATSALDWPLAAAAGVLLLGLTLAVLGLYRAAIGRVPHN